MTKQKRPVDKPFASGTMTKAAFFSFIRSGLRQKSRRWKPIYDCLNAAKRPSKDKKNKRLKWQFLCKKCKSWVPRTEITVDHIIPAGSLNSLEDLPGFVSRLFCEVDGLQAICKNCHAAKTEEERHGRKVQKER